jgi:hypothetical protein
MNGVVYGASWSYLGFFPMSVQGGATFFYYFRWTEGAFYNPSRGYLYIGILQEVFADGTWWKDKYWEPG